MVFLYIRAPHLDGVFSVSFWRNLGKVGYVMLLAEESYVSESRSHFDQLGDNALHGLIGGLDSYSTYLTDSEFETYDIPTRQSYGGIGAEVREVEGKVYIMGLNPQGGAREVGFLAGDWIVEVDGQDVSMEGTGGVVALLRGEPKTTVQVGVRREGEAEVLRRSVERRQLTFASIGDVELLEGNVGYIPVGIFGQRTADELREAIGKMVEDNVSGLILDLRNNPGGLLTAAQEMIDLFVPANQTVLSVEGRGAGVVQQFRTTEPVFVPEYLPIVILQNRFSASASEILAGVLQSLGRAVVVGEVSHGKGSVQSVFQFEGGDGLSLTTARYILPDGRAIEGVGLEPDMVVDLSEEDILRLSIQSSHDFGLSEDEFVERFGFTPVEDETLETARRLITGEQRDYDPRS